MANAVQATAGPKATSLFGSPLDKTAFIFRTQKTQQKIDVREALAAAKQPCIARSSAAHPGDTHPIA